MSTDNDTVPAAETDFAAPTSLSEIFDARHQPQASHEPHREVGAGLEPEAPPAPADASAAPAPAPAAAPQRAQPAPTAENPTPEAEEVGPKWYRDSIKRERELRKQAEQRLAIQGGGEPRPAAQPGPSDEDLDRPLTLRELNAHNERVALIGRLERSEERFVDRLGDDTFQATREWLTTRPDIEEWALKQRDPWAAAHQQYTREQLATEIGEDPNAWRDREREKLRAEILAEQQGGAQPAPAPVTPQMRAAPPAPASTARSAQPRDDSGRFAGVQPLKTRNSFD